MTPENFTYWLEGILASPETDPATLIKLIREKMPYLMQPMQPMNFNIGGGYANVNNYSTVTGGTSRSVGYGSSANMGYTSAPNLNQDYSAEPGT